jgi:hypothetical protein
MDNNNTNKDYSWQIFKGKEYVRYVEEKIQISEEEALSRYDEILKDIKKTVSAYNYKAMMRSEPLMISTEDLTHYLRPHNEWAKKSNWSSRLKTYMRSRGFYK